MKFKMLLEGFQIKDFINEFLDYYWYWLGAGKRSAGLSGNPTAQKKGDKLYDKYNDYIRYYDFEGFLFTDILDQHTNEIGAEYPDLKKYERTKFYDIKTAPILLEKMKKFMASKGEETVKKFMR